MNPVCLPVFSSICLSTYLQVLSQGRRRRIGRATGGEEEEKELGEERELSSLSAKTPPITPPAMGMRQKGEGDAGKVGGDGGQKGERGEGID